MQSLLQAVKITDTDRAKIDSGRQRVRELQTLSGKAAPLPPHMSYQAASPSCHLKRQADEAVAAFEQDPTHPNMEAAHRAAVRLAEAGQTAAMFAGILNRAVAAESATLAQITGGILDSALAALEGRRTAALSAASKADDVLVDVTGTINARADGLARQLEAEREEAARVPLEWLAGHDLAPDHDTEEPAPAPAPAPPAKNFRGKVRLDKPAEPEVPADVLSQLDDGDEIDLEDPLSLLAGN